MTDSACPFCRIISGEGQARILHRDEEVLAFRDILPVAPTHILIVPSWHVASLEELEGDGSGLLSRMISIARDLAKREGVAGEGYRLVINTGANAGQSVDHLHLHLLAGRRMGWPPG